MLLKRYDPEKQVAEFNAKYPIGTKVIYWRGARREVPSGEGRTRAEASVLGEHTAVVWIEGCSGCIALSHVTPIPGD